MQSDVSVIIPVHNNEKTIKNAVESVLFQTWKNIEIICVDDGSEDKSLSILRSYEKKDSRLQVISLPHNQGTLKARKYGVQASSGRYVMFLDADDLYKEDACKCAYLAISNAGTDIVHFGTEVLNSNHLSEERIHLNEKLLRPHKGKISGNLLNCCFIDHLFTANLWNKIYKGDICRQAFSHLVNSNLRKGEDWYTFFVIAYYSRTYEGIDDILYQYNLGAGGTGSEMDLNQFKMLLTEKDTYDAIKAFLANKDTSNYKNVLNNLQYHFLDECVFKWANELSIQEKAKGYVELVKTWGHKLVMIELAHYWWDNHYELSGYLKESGIYTSCVRDHQKPLTIAFYYRSISGGGAQRVAALLSNRFSEVKDYQGKYMYQVLLITDEGPQKEEYELSERVIREYLPGFIKSKGANYLARYEKWQQILERRNIDVVVSGLWVDPCTFWDMLTVKGFWTKPSFIIHSHNFCAVPFIFPNHEAKELLAKYMICDGVAALSEIDERYISAFNHRVKCIVNPLAFDPDDVPNSTYTPNTVIWCGRISSEKKPVDAIRMMYELHKINRAAQLYIVGGGDKKIIQEMKNLVKIYHLEDNVFFEGFQLDVGKYYSRASVFISTAEYEGFSLTFSEALSFAVPIVTYEMPWLTFTRDGRGILSVPQGRYDLMARQVATLLDEPEQIFTIGHEGKALVSELAHADIIAQWQRLLDMAVYGKQVEKENISDENQNANILLQYMTLWSEIGRRRAVQTKRNGLLKRNQLKKNQEEQICRNLKFDIDSLKNSVSFRTGRFLTWGPRKARGCYYCLNQHGFNYTVKRFIEHLGINMGTGDYHKNR